MTKKRIFLFVLACSIIIAGILQFNKDGSIPFTLQEPSIDGVGTSRVYFNELDLERLINRYLSGHSIIASGGLAVSIQTCQVSCRSSQLLIAMNVNINVAGNSTSSRMMFVLKPQVENGHLLLRLLDVYWQQHSITSLPWLDHCWAYITLPVGVSYQDKTWTIDVEPFAHSFNLLDAAVVDHYLILTFASKW